MKKQLFSLVMLLALVVFAGTSAWAQAGSGLKPNETKEIIRGSIVHFAVTDATGATAASTYDWKVYSGLSTDPFTQGGTALTAGTNWDFATSLTNDAVPTEPKGTEAWIKFLTKPSVANGIYIVEVTAHNTNCTTLRRFFISVFDFEVDVFLSESNGNPITGEGTTYQDIAGCNTWGGKIIHNGLLGATTAFEGDSLTGPHANYVANSTTPLIPKTTTYYFTVKIELTGNTSMDLDNLKWRMRYSLTNGAVGASTDTDLKLYRIANTSKSANTNNPSFTTEATGPQFIGGDNTPANATTVLSIDASGYSSVNSAIYFPAGSGAATFDNNTATYTFEVVTHNLLSQGDMTWGIRADEVDLETTTTDVTANAYNNGTKYHAEVATGLPAGGHPISLIDGKSGTYTIQQSPATSTIKVND